MTSPHTEIKRANPTKRRMRLSEYFLCRINCVITKLSLAKEIRISFCMIHKGGYLAKNLIIMRLSVIFFLSIILASCASKEEKIESSVESAIENRLKEWLIERTNPQLSELEECIDEVPDWAERCERALNCLKSDKFPECALPKASAVCTATSPGLYDVEISFSEPDSSWVLGWCSPYLRKEEEFLWNDGVWSMPPSGFDPGRVSLQAYDDYWEEKDKKPYFKYDFWYYFDISRSPMRGEL